MSDESHTINSYKIFVTWSDGKQEEVHPPFIKSLEFYLDGLEEERNDNEAVDRMEEGEVN
jgi:hypothetical protein